MLASLLENTDFTDFWRISRMLGTRSKCFALAIASIMCGQVRAETILPAAAGKLDTTPLPQAMATMRVLGEFRLMSGGQARLMEVMSREGGECGVGGGDDADICPRFTLYVSANGETSQPVDFALFRLPETLGWKLPEGSVPKSDYGKIEFGLSACETKPTEQGTGWKGVSYRLRLNQNLITGGDGYGHFRFSVDLQKLPGEREDCAG